MKISNFIDAMDELFSTQLGEKGHLEYSWNKKDMMESILQIFFQLVRRRKGSRQNGCCSSVIQRIDETLRELFMKKQELGPISSESMNLLCLMFRMLAQTRDIEHGKGEYELAYEFLFVWSKHHLSSACFMMEQFVLGSGADELPLGSWKDTKYMCNFIAKKLSRSYLTGKDVFDYFVGEKSSSTNSSILSHPFIRHICNIVVNQLRQDENNLKEERLNSLSLVGKWIPREGCPKFGWINALISVLYYHPTSVLEERIHKNEYIKCRVRLRKLLSILNKNLDTIQVKQCAKQWSTIDFNHLTSKTLLVQRSALLNKGKRISKDTDRLKCAKDFESFILSRVKENKTIKGSKIMMNEFTSHALALKYSSESSSEVLLLNKQWEDSSSKTKALGKVVAMVDVSGSMNGDPLHAAIALGIRVAEKSMLGKRVLTFASSPNWVNLHHEQSFVSMVTKLAKADWGGTTNFYGALKMILSAIKTKKLPASEVQGMVLVIFSDMQMDVGDSSWNKSLYQNICMKYREAGIQCCGTPYEPPHILFWNLRSTDGFPVTKNSCNVTMLAGYSAALLNAFAENGVEGLMKQTGFENLVSILSDSRYDSCEKRFRELMEQKEEC